MIYRRSYARLSLQLSVIILFSTEIPSQQLQRYKPIQLGVARLINGSHSANTECFDYEKVIEGSLNPDPLAAVWTWDARQWFCRGRINRRSASGTCLAGGFTRHWAAIVTFRLYRAKRSRASPRLPIHELLLSIRRFAMPT